MVQELTEQLRHVFLVVEREYPKLIYQALSALAACQVLCEFVYPLNFAHSVVFDCIDVFAFAKKNILLPNLIITFLFTALLYGTRCWFAGRLVTGPPG